MGLFIARFEDRPAGLNLRRAHQKAHDAYITGKEGKILVTGPMSRDDLGNPIGALWYIEAKSRRDAESICYGSPFWAVGLWTTVTILPQQFVTHSYANMRVTCL